MAEAIISRRGSNTSSKRVLITETITTNTNWKLPNYLTEGSIHVMVYGAGGGGNYVIGAGGGGYMNEIDINVTEINDEIPIIIGLGGNNRNSGGTTSFGTFISANGGEYSVSGNGGNGGSGGGGQHYSSGTPGNGGIGYQFGGGGGAMGGGCGGNGGMYGGGGGGSGWDRRSIVGKGGDGGLYGGGGGGGAASLSNTKTCTNNGGNGGDYGGGGGGGAAYYTYIGSNTSGKYCWLNSSRYSNGGNGGIYGGNGGPGRCPTDVPYNLSSEANNNTLEFVNIYNPSNSSEYIATYLILNTWLNTSKVSGENGTNTSTWTNVFNDGNEYFRGWGISPNPSDSSFIASGSGGGGYGGNGGSGVSFNYIISGSFSVGGGGGGGYGSNGGTILYNNSGLYNFIYFGSMLSSGIGGGGGGGFGGDGGHSTLDVPIGGGGGGGGYGKSAKGGNGNRSGGGGGGYYGRGGDSINNFSGGGGGYGNGGEYNRNVGFGGGACSYSNQRAGNGICIIQYYI